MYHNLPNSTTINAIMPNAIKPKLPFYLMQKYPMVRNSQFFYLTWNICFSKFKAKYAIGSLHHSFGLTSSFRQVPLLKLRSAENFILMKAPSQSHKYVLVIRKWRFFSCCKYHYFSANWFLQKLFFCKFISSEIIFLQIDFLRTIVNLIPC